MKNMSRAKTVHSLKPYSYATRTGLAATYDIAEKIEKGNIEGSFVECGVARGGSSALLALVAARNKSSRKTWLFDSFEGLPDPSNNDPEDSSLIKGSCLGTYDKVEELLFSKMELNREMVILVKGWFQETLSQHKDKVGAISLLRLDADWYESTKCCLHSFYENVVPGGYVLIDDYGFLSGCQKAVDEFIKEKNINVNIVPVEQQHLHYFIKPGSNRERN